MKKTLLSKGITEQMVFKYAIKFPDGQYYTGADYVRQAGGRWGYVDKPENKGAKHEAMTYAEMRAYAKIAANPKVFAGCTVENVA